jgi:hypothetical protein
MQQRRPQPGMTSNMAGVSVRGNLLAFDCEDINFADQKLGEAELLPLLHALSRGEFARLKRLNLVRAASALWPPIDLTYAHGAEGK